MHEPNQTNPKSPPAAPKFRDAAGREWRPRLDYAKLRRVRDKTGVDLGDVEQLGGTWARLLYDDLTALEVIWIAIDDGADGCSKDEWLAAMEGPALDAAMLALRAAVVNFTRPQKRGLTTQAIDAVTEGFRLAMTQIEEQTKAVTDEAIERAVAAALGSPPPSAPE